MLKGEVGRTNGLCRKCYLQVEFPFTRTLPAFDPVPGIAGADSRATWREAVDFATDPIFAPLGVHWGRAHQLGLGYTGLDMFRWVSPADARYPGYWVFGPYEGPDRACYCHMLMKRPVDKLLLLGPFRSRM